jgi:hypothetical protein
MTLVFWRQLKAASTNQTSCREFLCKRKQILCGKKCNRIFKRSKKVNMLSLSMAHSTHPPELIRIFSLKSRLFINLANLLLKLFKSLPWKRKYNRVNRRRVLTRWTQAISGRRHKLRQNQHHRLNPRLKSPSQLSQFD